MHPVILDSIQKIYVFENSNSVAFINDISGLKAESN